MVKIYNLWLNYRATTTAEKTKQEQNNYKNHKNIPLLATREKNVSSTKVVCKGLN